MSAAVPRAGRRHQTLEQLAAVIGAAAHPGHVVRVAVDGVDGAGKTVFVDELADVLRQRGAAVLRASVDGFHQPPRVRYRRGRSSPEGFFLDSYEYPRLRRLLLDPLGPRGDRRIVRRVYDVHAEEPVESVAESVPDAQVLVFDGIFLHRPQLRDLWDPSVFLEVDFEISIPRGASRGYGDPDVAAASNRRYIEGQHRYLDTCQPHLHATRIVNNNVLTDAHITGTPGS